MKKKSLRERISYRIDYMMSKGPIAMSVLLFAVTAAIVGFIGIVAYFVSDDGGLLFQLWSSLMYTLDPGNLAGVPTDNLPYLLLMFLATLCGLFLTSILIGVIATGVESKLSDLRKGFSVVQEENHTVIIGFDINTYVLLRELIEANANQSDACVVVLGEQPKDEMEDRIASHIPHTQTTRIICRSGNLHETYALEHCSVESAKSVILNTHSDAETVKVLLALSTYLKDKELTCPDLQFIVSLQDSQYMEAARIAGEGRAEILYAKDAISRIIANTCRQHGLSQVLSELFNFSGHELYFERIPQLAGKTFHEVLLRFSNAIVFGLYTNGQTILNPPMDTVIQKDDLVVLLEEDDGAYIYHNPRRVESLPIRNGNSVAAQASNHLLILGSNEKLPLVLSEYNLYVQPGTKVVIMDDDLDETKLGTYENLEISVCTQPITRDLLCEFTDGSKNNILLLNDDSQAPEASDAQTLLHLILLRDISDTLGRHFTITTEMRSTDNQRLASQARVDDFVIGSNFVCLLMAQVSENPKLIPMITEILDESGSELYMKPAANYVAIGTPVDSYTLTESAARKGEIFVGYRLTGSTNVVINPNKEDLITFGPEDQLILIAKE